MLKKIKQILKERKKRQRNIRNIDNIIREKIALHYFNQLSLTSNVSLISNDSILDKEVIVSFTTYSKRIYDVHLVLESLAYQTIKPNKVILWLDENEFSFDDIPLIVKNYINRGLEIKFCENYKSYKKIIPTLINYPDSHIITIDDDIIYPHDMIEQLVQEHKVHPKLIIGHRAHKIKNKNNQYLPYKKWNKNIKECTEGYDIFLTGCGGIFYPNNSLDKDTTNAHIFMNLCPHADDIWLKFMANNNNIPHKKTNDMRDFDERFIIIKNNQDIGLNKKNVDNNENDIQIAKLLQHYNINGIKT